MYVIVEDAEENRTAVFGVQDFATGDSGVELHFPREEDADPMHADGSLSRAAAIPGHNQAGLEEVVTDLLAQDVDVYAADTPETFPLLARALDGLDEADRDRIHDV